MRSGINLKVLWYIGIFSYDFKIDSSFLAHMDMFKCAFLIKSSPLSVRPSVCKLFTFLNLNSNLTKLGTKPPYGKWILNVKIEGTFLLKREIIAEQ